MAHVNRETFPCQMRTVCTLPQLVFARLHVLRFLLQFSSRYTAAQISHFLFVLMFGERRPVTVYFRAFLCLLCLKRTLQFDHGLLSHRSQCVHVDLLCIGILLCSCVRTHVCPELLPATTKFSQTLDLSSTLVMQNHFPKCFPISSRISINL